MLQKIRPVQYKWNGLWGGRNDGRQVVGVIGQELEAAAPYAVMRTLDRLYKNGTVTEILEIDTTAVIMLLINTFRELEDRLSVLRNKKTN